MRRRNSSRLFVFAVATKLRDDPNGENRIETQERQNKDWPEMWKQEKITGTVAGSRNTHGEAFTHTFLKNSHRHGQMQGLGGGRPLELTRQHRTKPKLSLLQVRMKRKLE